MMPRFWTRCTRMGFSTCHPSDVLVQTLFWGGALHEWKTPIFERWRGSISNIVRCPPLRGMWIHPKTYGNNKDRQKKWKNGKSPGGGPGGSSNGCHLPSGPFSGLYRSCTRKFKFNPHPPMSVARVKLESRVRISIATPQCPLHVAKLIA